MGELISPGDIARCVDVFYIGAKLIVNLDVTTLVDFNPGMFQTEIVGIRHATDCEKDMGADDSLIAAAAINLHGYFVAAFFEGDAFSAEAVRA